MLYKKELINSINLTNKFKILEKNGKTKDTRDNGKIIQETKGTNIILLNKLKKLIQQKL